MTEFTEQLQIGESIDRNKKNKTPNKGRSTLFLALLDMSPSGLGNHLSQGVRLVLPPSLPAAPICQRRRDGNWRDMRDNAPFYIETIVTLARRTCMHCNPTPCASLAVSVKGHGAPQS
jgi:hypothetical protein